MSWFRKKPATGCAVEFDIEGIDVAMIDRTPDGETKIVEGNGDEWTVCCDESQHSGFVARFRAKLKARDEKKLEAA